MPKMMDAERKNQLIELHKTCFNDGDYIEFFFENRLSESNVYVEEKDGEILSACYARFFDIVLQGNLVKVPFLTGVATAPKHRYSGHARKVVEKAKTDLASKGYPFLMLHPFNHDFYRKLGFQTINYIHRIVPSGSVIEGVVVKALVKEDLPVISDLYNKVSSTYTAYKTRGLKEFELLVGNSLINGGFGYLIYQNGIPKGYVWCEDGVCVEAVAEEEYLLDALTLPLDYTLPLIGGKEEYSMGAVLGLESLLQSIPYCKEASGEVFFAYKGINYKLSVTNGKFNSLSVHSSQSQPLDEREIISICLGQGKCVENNPFEGIIPYYDLFCYEIY